MHIIRKNLEAIISRYESTSVTAVLEMEHLLRTLRLTTEMLREELPGIDLFDVCVHDHIWGCTDHDFFGVFHFLLHRIFWQKWMKMQRWDHFEVDCFWRLIMKYIWVHFESIFQSINSSVCVARKTKRISSCWFIVFVGFAIHSNIDQQ